MAAHVVTTLPLPTEDWLPFTASVTPADVRVLVEAALDTGWVEGSDQVFRVPAGVRVSCYEMY